MTSNRIASTVGAVLFAVVGGWGLVASLSPADPRLGPLIAGVLATSVPLAVVQLALAAVLALGAGLGDRGARRVNVTVGSLLLALGLLGLFVVSTPANMLALSGPANVVHFACSAGLLAAGLGVRGAEPG